MANNVGPPISIPEFTMENWMPMEPLQGPPLPKFLQIFWPWYKPTPPLPPIYTCPYCASQFSTEAELLAHIEAEHPGEPPIVYYTCPTCGATFTTQEELSAHILAEHPEEVPAAQITGVPWSVIDFPFSWYGQTGPYTTVLAKFIRAQVEIQSDQAFTGKIEVVHPELISRVPVMSEADYQEYAAEIDYNIANDVFPGSYFWQGRKDGTLPYPSVNGFRINFGNFDKSGWWWMFTQDWLMKKANSVSFDVDIPAGTSTIAAAFFKNHWLQQLNTTYTLTINLYRNNELLDTIQSDVTVLGNHVTYEDGSSLY